MWDRLQTCSARFLSAFSLIEVPEGFITFPPSDCTLASRRLFKRQILLSLKPEFLVAVLQLNPDWSKNTVFPLICGWSLLKLCCSWVIVCQHGSKTDFKNDLKESRWDIKKSYGGLRDSDPGEVLIVSTSCSACSLPPLLTWRLTPAENTYDVRLFVCHSGRLKSLDILLYTSRKSENE